jgi:predicted metalloprotease with PDZ domain
MGLERYDYFQENYTTGLWLSEGFTSYYQEKVLYQAGLLKREGFLDALSQLWNRLQTIPGRKAQTLREASFDAWIRLYRADENTINSTVSYYLKGAIAAFGLDVLIQRYSKGKHSLDDVMRGLWRDYLDKGPGQSEELIFELCSQYAGRDLGDELELLIGRTEDPPLVSWCEGVGLHFVQEPASRDHPWWGFDVKESGGRITVKQVRRDSPAWDGGLLPGDEIVGISEIQVETPFESFVQKLLLQVGQPATFNLFRRGELKKISLTALPCPYPQGHFRDGEDPGFCVRPGVSE